MSCAISALTSASKQTASRRKRRKQSLSKRSLDISSTHAEGAMFAEIIYHPRAVSDHFLSLGEELSTKATHFVLELIQNADDNAYPDGVIPTLVVVLEDSRLTVQCNEIGFDEANIRAICSIGQSTKRDRKGTSGYIGAHHGFSFLLPY